MKKLSALASPGPDALVCVALLAGVCAELLAGQEDARRFWRMFAM